MTDAEKELRRLAEHVRDHPGRSIRLAVACSSSVVLALLDRIEALEKENEDLEARNEGLYNRNSELKERLRDLG
jgi:hypothetical protein